MLRILTLNALLALLLVRTWAQDDTAPLAFTALSEDAVIRHSEDRTAWDGTFTDPGAVIVHDGVFHMFRNGFRSWPGEVGIEHLTSEDGVTWTPAPAGPIIVSEDVPFTEVGALASGVLVEKDGTWMLYFYSHESMSGRTAPGRIGRATAPAPEGPWTVDPEPVLEPGPEGAWDELRVVHPRVIKTEDGYVMYYTGINTQGSGWQSIGRATSTDGITWTKYDDPATTATAFAESDPVLTAAEDGVQIHQPSVFRVNDTYMMLYRTFPLGGGDTQMTVHAAISEDGIDWTPMQDGPLWDRNTITAANTFGFWFTVGTYHDGTVYLFVEEGSMGGTNIYAGSFRLPGM